MKELDVRTTDGVEVRLLWQPGSDRVVVDVVDAKLDDTFRIDVEGARALDAFRHPYAYAAFGGVAFATSDAAPVCA
jgi:hypothetical protein